MDNISKTASLFLEKSHKLILLSRFNQLKQKDEQACGPEKGRRMMRAREIEKKIEQERV